MWNVRCELAVALVWPASAASYVAHEGIQLAMALSLLGQKRTNVPGQNPPMTVIVR